jgi:cation diffusion facilitator CzcD-associated flavoprotein CzcO
MVAAATNTNTKRTMSIAVIGSGPGGMAFCHAIETRKQQALAQGDSLSLAETQLQVTCFEQSPSPGGVWKASTPDDDTIHMYDALWTNGPSPNMEFADYTYAEHFGDNNDPRTVYMPRRHVLEYLMGRVTKNCPTFFETYCQFRTTVQQVRYDEAARVFHVVTTTTTPSSTPWHGSSSSQQPHVTTKEHVFDKVVWACGDNGKQKIPASLQELFTTTTPSSNNYFTGRFIHSSDTAQLGQDVRGKRILLIGGGLSAEDLALQAIKLGVEMVYIVIRENDSEGTVTEAWPEHRVQILRQQEVCAVQGRRVWFRRVLKDFDGKSTYPEEYTNNSDLSRKKNGVSTELKDIDTVICCTGYRRNLDMLEKDLWPCHPDQEKYPLDVPIDWKMPWNVMTEHVGENVPLGTVSYLADELASPVLYHGGVLIKNTAMMFVWSHGGDFPILAVDTSAWLLAAYCTGHAVLPPPEEMRQQMREQAIRELGMPYCRLDMDSNYFDTVMAVPGCRDSDDYEEEWIAMENEYTVYRAQLLAGHMRAVGNYPLDIGTNKELNKLGEALLHFDDLSDEHRTKITRRVIKRQPWKTFRDYTNGHQFYSLHTGTRAVSLPKRWMDMFDDGENDGLVHEEKKKAM